MLELDDIQGFLLQPQIMPVARYFFLRIDEPLRGCEWLGQMLTHITRGTPWREPPRSYTSLAFTYTGLKALGVPQPSLESFAPEFRDGMVQRAGLLGDTGASSPLNWPGGLGTPDLHAMLIVSAQDSTELEARSSTYRALMQIGGVAELTTQEAAALDGRRDHFGYRDAISDIVIEGTPEAPKPNKGPPLKPGEFFFGYPDETGQLPEMPQPHALGRNASYLVYRRLYEDVAGFRRFLRAQTADAAEAEWLAAKMMGRWRSGAPLVLAPTRDDPALAEDYTRNNDFNYAEMDPQGLACPLGAHIRRVNPRDSIHGVNRNRLIRRGLPYGSPLADGAPDDGVDRGVIIFFGNASISRQFEFVQSVWINNRKFNGLENEKDPLVGDNDGTYDLTIQRKPFRKRIHGIPRFTIVKGGGYFFLPGLRALRWLVAGSAA